MKKILLVLMALVLAMPMYALKTVGTYRLSSGKREVLVDIETKNSMTLYVQVVGDKLVDDIFMLIEDVENIKAFRESLIQLKDKHTEWVQVAKDNNVDNLVKEVSGISFPNVRIYWHSYSNNWFLSKKFQLKNFKFIIISKDSMAMTNGGEAASWDNEYITQDWSMYFFSPDEIQSLIDCMDMDLINKSLVEEVQVDNLFK